MFIKSLIAAFTLEQKTEENQSPCRSRLPIAVDLALTPLSIAVNHDLTPISPGPCRSRPRPDHLALVIHVDLAADHTLALAVPITSC
jgi:hypothetical protein